MNGNHPALREHFRRLAPAYWVLLLSLALTGFVYRRVRVNVAARDQARFDQTSQALQDLLVQRMESFLSALRGLRGLFDANPLVEPGQWKNYARSIDLKGNYRGVLDIGFAQHVSRDGVEAHVARMRAAGFPNYRLQTDVGRDEYFPIVYLSSSVPSTNWAPGWDPFNEPQRREAMERARRADRPIATGKVTLLTPDGPKPEPGLVIYLPVYRGGVRPAGEGAQKEATIGFVFASLVARELGAAILSGQTNRLVDMEVFDSDTPSADNLLFDGDRILSVRQAGAGRRIEKSVTVEGLGRTWTMHFSTLPAFEAESRQVLPAVALIGGLTVSLLLFWVIWTEAQARAAAEVLGSGLRQSEELQKRTNEELRARIREREEVEEALAEEKERLAVTLRSFGDGVINTDIEGKVVLLKKAAEGLIGWTGDEVSGRPLDDFLRLLDEDNRRRLECPVAQFLTGGMGASRSSPAALVSRHSRERIVVFSGAPIHDQADQTIGAVLVFRDITENRKLEADLPKP